MNTEKIETSIFQGIPACKYCKHQGIQQAAFLIFSTTPLLDKQAGIIRVMCENGHVYAVAQSEIRNITQRKHT